VNDQSSEPAECTEHKQARDWRRFPPELPERRLIVEGQPKNAVVLDESIGGIGVMLEMEDAVNVRVGDALTVLPCDCPTRGRVQWIQENPETKQVRVGIRWAS